MTETVLDEYVAHKGDVALQIYRRRDLAAVKSGASLPVLFMVHGSSFSARTSYDLDIPGHGDYSMLKVFAGFGFDVWTMDHEGYGRSSQTEGNSDIASGVADLEAALPILEAETGQSRYAFFGQSSGGLRAGAFANKHPDRVSRLVLSAFVWTGENAPTLIKRRERLAEWRDNNRRVVDEDYYFGVFNRDVRGLTIPELPAAAAKAEMDNGGGSVPNGTYYDMCVKLPLVDPAKIDCPVLIVRGDHDGIATDEDLLAFYEALPNKDKQFVALAGMAHNTQLGVNRARFWHVMRNFLTMPERVDQ